VALNLIFGYIADIVVREMADRDDEILYVNACEEEEEAFGGEGLKPCQQWEMGACTCSGRTCRLAHWRQ
jgi:hypothetical protein